VEEDGVESTSDDLIAVLVHDLRGPLNTLMMGLQYLRMSGLISGHERAEAILVRSEAAGAQMMRLIENLLELERLRTGQSELSSTPVVLAELCNQVVSHEAPPAERRGVRITVEIPSTHTPIFVDPGMLERILFSLLDNALKYAPADSTVGVAARVSEDWLTLSVTDGGPGIPFPDPDRALDQLGTSGPGRPQESVGAERSRSIGLALVYCRAAAEACGGKFGAENAEGGGCRFYVRLPLRPATG
jgi:two-component system sensor histidine kinase KdpD